MKGSIAGQEESGTPRAAASTSSDDAVAVDIARRDSEPTRSRSHRQLDYSYCECAGLLVLAWRSAAAGVCEHHILRLDSSLRANFCRGRDLSAHLARIPHSFVGS